MTHRVTVIQGHPDGRAEHFGHALARAYVSGALAAGSEVRQFDVGRMAFPLLRSKEEFDHGAPPEAVREVQEAIRWADHLVLFYPLWLGGMPAVLKGLLEQVLRPGFAVANYQGRGPRQLLRGKSARVVVTMGMPAFVYRWYFGAHSVKSLRRNVLAFCGIAPIKTSFIGMVESSRERRRQAWLARMQVCGRRGL